MNFIRKCLKTSFALLMLCSLASCSSGSKSSRDSSTAETTSSAAETTTSAVTTGSTPALTTAVPDITDVTEVPTAVYPTETVTGIADGSLLSDKEAVNALCNDMCRRWGEFCEGYISGSFSDIVQYSSLSAYLATAVKNHNWQLLPDGTAYFELTSFETREGYSVAKGVCRGREAAFGGYTFIVTAPEGRLLINDMIVDAQESHDNVYRPEFVKSPYPDFWRDNTILVKPEEA